MSALNGKLPVEFWFCVVAGGAIIGLLGWWGLTRGEPAPKRTVGAAGFGATLVLLGLSGVVYFLNFFDVGVSTSAGRVANLDLMSQRQSYVTVCCVVSICGVLLATLGRRSSGR
jgi:hypothetical protein